jgi:hypothetical protein
MADARPSFSWWHRKSHEKSEKSGPFAFAEIQPLLDRVAQGESVLLLSLSGVNLDFTACESGETEMEIHDAHGMHIDIVTLEQAKEVARRALLDLDASILRGKLCDIPIEWLCTSHQYAYALQAVGA